MKALVLLVALCPVIANAITINPSADGTIHDGNRDGIPDGLPNSTGIQVLDAPGVEDRGAAEFPLAGLSSPITSAYIFVGQIHQANGPFPFEIDVFGYEGDGALSLADWNAGVKLATFVYTGDPYFFVNVTSFVAASVTSAFHYAGFRLEFAVPSSITPNGPYLSWADSSNDLLAPMKLIVNENLPQITRVPDSLPAWVSFASFVTIAILGLTARWSPSSHSHSSH